MSGEGRRRLEPRREVMADLSSAKLERQRNLRKTVYPIPQVNMKRSLSEFFLVPLYCGTACRRTYTVPKLCQFSNGDFATI